MPDTGDILCIRDNTQWKQRDEVSVPYASMITSDGTQPIADNEGRYSCAVLLNASDVPVGVGFVTQWRGSDLSARILPGYFNQVDLVEFTEKDVDTIIEHARSRSDSDF